MATLKMSAAVAASMIQSVSQTNPLHPYTALDSGSDKQLVFMGTAVAKIFTMRLQKSDAVP